MGRKNSTQGHLCAVADTEAASALAPFGERTSAEVVPRARELGGHEYVEVAPANNSPEKARERARTCTRE